ncbi:MAG: CDP-alcohol phosphatidyltransferase family protein [Deltaproteobacteria bacterium]|nr:CDP-alcohol phosphatidyltransferase family protein [Deltaproteobacteria bacterium]
MAIYNIIAHILTLTRILLTPFFAACIYYVKDYPHLNEWMKIILIIVAATDWLDGFIAKNFGKKSALGTLLDPIADKIFLDTSIIMVSISYNLPLPITMILVGRDIIVLIVWSFYIFVSEKKYQAVAHPFGKIMIAFQIATIASVALYPKILFVKALCFGAAFFSICSAIIYIIKIDKYRQAIE